MLVKPVEILWRKLQRESKVLSILLIKLGKSRRCFLLARESVPFIITHSIYPPVFLLVARGDVSIDQQPNISVSPSRLGSSLLQALPLLPAGPTVPLPHWPLSCPWDTHCIAATKMHANRNNPDDTVCGHKCFITFLIWRRGKKSNNPLQWRQKLLV